MHQGKRLKILLTGVTGFLGSHLCRALLTCGYEVVGLKRRTSDISRLDGLTEKLVLVDVEDGLEKLFEHNRDINVVIHAATNYGNQGGYLSEIFMANVMLPLRILEMMSANKGGVFVNTDTFFSKTADGYSYLADYILSKKLFCQLGRRSSEKSGSVFINVRLEHVFGSGDGSGKFTSSIISQLLDNDPDIKLTGGEQLRDFVFIDDVVAAYMKIISSESVMSSREMRDFEVGSGVARSVRDFVMAAHRIVGSQSSLSFGALPYREHEIMRSVANLEAIQGLGWSPAVDMETGIEKMVAEMRQFRC